MRNNYFPSFIVLCGIAFKMSLLFRLMTCVRERRCISILNKRAVIGLGFFWRNNLVMAD